MHILLIHQAFLSANQPGGTRHYEFARHCVEAGHEVTVVASDVDYLTGERLDRPRVEEIDGIRIRRARTIRGIHRNFLFRILGFLSFMVGSVREALRAGDVDLVMGTSPSLFQGLSAWAVAAMHRRPFLLEIRDLWPDFAIDMGVLTNPALIWIARRLEGFLYRNADHLLVNSPAYREYLQERGISPGRITLIPNGVDAGMFDPEARGEAVREELRLDGKYVVAYTGAIGPANDIPTLVRAASRLRHDDEIRLLLVGDGKARPEVEALVAELGLDNVIFAGARPKARMKEVLGAADVCVATLLPIPMFAMTYPNKVFDYLAAGRPIVLAIDGVIREVVEKARAGIFVPPGDDEALAEAVAHLKREPDEARDMGRRGREYVVRYFARSEHAAAFLDLVGLLGGRRRG